VYALDFADGSFDVVHAHQVLQHLTDPVAALIEMRRVCRPGGLIAARDGD
jgi:ubiquinone/menaquinone biosynthesis C-methylase UbiE